MLLECASPREYHFAVVKFPTCLLDFMPLATLRGYTQDNNRKFFMTNEGVNYDVHDFPSSELGLKLGGYMMLSSTETILDKERS